MNYSKVNTFCEGCIPHRILLGKYHDYESGDDFEMAKDYSIYKQRNYSPDETLEIKIKYIKMGNDNSINTRYYLVQNFDCNPLKEYKKECDLFCLYTIDVKQTHPFIHIRLKDMFEDSPWKSFYKFPECN